MDLDTDLTKTDRKRISVDALLDSPPLKPLQYLVIVLCALVALFDGLDSQAIAVAAPMMAADLHMKVGQFTPALSAALLGAAIGALAFGAVADRFGRRPVLIAATLLFGIFTLLTALPMSFGSLIAIRFIAGLGLGGATPCFITLTSEFAPTRHRTAITTLQWAAYPLGNAAGGFTNAFVITHSTWHTVFLVAGVPTILLTIFMLFFLPESLRYLVVRGSESGNARDLARSHKLARRLDRSIGTSPVELFAAANHKTRLPEMRASASWAMLFAKTRRTGTLVLWTLLFLGFATTTVTTIMTPTLLHAAGVGLGVTGTLVGIYSICSMIGMAISGKMVQKFGPAAALTPAFVIGSCVLPLVGVFHDPILLGCCMVVFGLSAPLGVAGALGLAASFYPVEVRSFGVGWGMGCGRFGQVCSPLVIGFLLTLAWTPDRILIVLAGAPLIAGIMVAIFSRSVKPVDEQTV